MSESDSQQTHAGISNTERFKEAKRRLNSVLIWAGLVGILIGLIGATFRMAVQHLIAQRSLFSQILSRYSVINWLIPSLIAGLLIFVSFGLMRRFAPDTSGSGIPQIEGALDNLLPLNWHAETGAGKSATSSQN